MEDETIDLRQYGLLLKRWSWLLVLSLVIGAATGLIVSLLSTPIFQSTAKVMITRAGQDQSSDVTAYLTTNQQTQTYLQLLQTESILNIVSERLGFELDEDAIDTKAIIDTQIIEINVEDPDPQRAALTADMLVEVLIEQNELISSERYDLMEESLSAQKAQIESQIADLQNQINHASIKTIEEQEQWIQEQINVLQQESETLPVEISQNGQSSYTGRARCIGTEKSTLGTSGIATTALRTELHRFDCIWEAGGWREYLSRFTINLAKHHSIFVSTNL